MEEFKRKRAKRSPAFTPEEMAILLDEVQQHRAILFRGTKGKRSVLAKNQLWQAITKRMAPSSPCGLRDWQGVRKKWQEFACQCKKKAAQVRRESQATGGGAPANPGLTPEEEKALYIIGKTATDGIDGSIDVLGDEGLTEPGPSCHIEEDEEAFGSGAIAAPPLSPAPSNSSLPPDISPPPSPAQTPRRPAGRSGVRLKGSLRRPSIVRCTCSETLVALETVKLGVLHGIEAHLRGIEAQLQNSNALQQQMMEIKREKLEVQRKWLSVAEAQFL